MCQFTKTAQCPSDDCEGDITIDFTDTVGMGNLVRGLADPKIKSIVLGEVKQKADLEELI